jgi:ubiquinone biosynthesis protein COQ9
VTDLDNDAIRDEILLATLPHIPFDGWGQSALNRGAVDAGHDTATARRLFQGGAAELIACHSRYADRMMLEELERRDVDSMKVRDRIITAVRIRLEQNSEHREAVRRGLSLLALPQNTVLATRLLYRTVDAIWHAAGDISTDYNFYTKRALLAGVYSTTLLYWLNDNSDGFEATWAFLERRVADVLKVPKVMARASGILGRLPDPFRMFRTARSL